jgi:hypothetical protein
MLDMQITYDALKIVDFNTGVLHMIQDGFARRNTVAPPLLLRPTAAAVRSCPRHGFVTGLQNEG